mgnify:CR=1 FL=1
MSGAIGSTQGNISSLATSTILYTSDYLTFGVGTRGFSWALSEVKDKASGANGPLFDALNKNIKAFTASISGNFDAEPKPDGGVPEPGTLAMLVGMGVAGSAIVVRRRTK